MPQVGVRQGQRRLPSRPSALALPIPHSISKTCSGSGNHLLPRDQMPRLQTDLSLRTQEEGTGWIPKQMPSSKENLKATVTRGGDSAQKHPNDRRKTEPDGPGLPSHQGCHRPALLRWAAPAPLERATPSAHCPASLCGHHSPCLK